MKCQSRPPSLGQVAIPNASEYITAKHGVVGLTRAAGAEYASRGIRVLGPFANISAGALLLLRRQG